MTTGGPRDSSFRRLLAALSDSTPAFADPIARTTESAPTFARRLLIALSDSSPAFQRRALTIDTRRRRAARNRASAAWVVRGRWSARLERSLVLLVSISTLSISGFMLAKVNRIDSNHKDQTYSEAVTHLGSSSEQVRIGGLYELAHIAQGSPPDAPTVIETISAFVRSGINPASHNVGDIKLAMQLLTSPLAPNVPVDLHGSDLHTLNLAGADLHGADLHGADLTGADLHGADLTVANLTNANLLVADLTVANLTNANLHGANLTGANLTNANLHGADLGGRIDIPYPRSRKVG